ncbi:MAG: DNA-3-methyladenine glycosylase family protein [Acidobacteriota bacterium]
MDARDRKALARLRKDPVLRGLVARIGSPRFHEYSRQDLLHNLLEAILAQQLSARAARSIFERFREGQGPGFPDPRRILATPEERLRKAGFSRAKVEAVKALCRAVLEGTLDLGDLPRRSDEEVVEVLTAIRGIGPWTAHMALIFALRRPDVWPAADLGLRKGLKDLLGLPALPSPREAEPLGDRWRPYRSYACWYLWQMNDGG